MICPIQPGFWTMLCKEQDISSSLVVEKCKLDNEGKRQSRNIYQLQQLQFGIHSQRESRKMHQDQ